MKTFDEMTVAAPPWPLKIGCSKVPGLRGSHGPWCLNCLTVKCQKHLWTSALAIRAAPLIAGSLLRPPWPDLLETKRNNNERIRPLLQGPFQNKVTSGLPRLPCGNLKGKFGGWGWGRGEKKNQKGIPSKMVFH